MQTKPVAQFDITWDRDTNHRHTWQITRDGRVIGTVRLVGQKQWTNGDQLVYQSRTSAAFALASRIPMEA